MQLKADTLITAIDMFKDDLRTYGHLNIPEFHMPKSFADRNDENLVLLARSCNYLSTLVSIFQLTSQYILNDYFQIITEKISTSTVLLIAYTGRNLKWLHVRCDAVIKKCDWPMSPEWSEEFYSWLKMNSKSYKSVEKEVSQILGYRWKLLTDQEFQNLDVNLHDF